MVASKKTETLQPSRAPGRPLDAFDRKLLAALAQDAGLSYAQLGDLVGLSAPAVHERVRKLRQSGCLRRTAALLDGAAIGKPLLAFVHIESAGWGASQQLMSIAELPEVEEIHSVAGDTCMLLKVRCASGAALEALLARLYATPGVKATRSYVVLSTYLERTVQAGITEFGQGP